MKLKSTILLAVSIMLTLMAYPQAGTLDNTFGSNGIVTYNYGAQYHDNTNGVHVYEDSTIIICGSHMDFSYNTTAVLQKFLVDGSIDMSWGTNGMVEIQYGVDTHPYSLIVLSDGKILISGVVFFATDAEFFAARFNPDGSPDLTFNTTGVWIGEYPNNVEMTCNDMLVQEDGKIILAGRNGITFSSLIFYRLNSDGTLDTGFGTNGLTEIDDAYMGENVNGIGLLSDGSIIGVGYKHLGDPWYGEFATMVKLDSSGNPDTGFGTNGVLIPSVFDTYSQAFDCVIVNDSVIISAAYGDPSVSEDFAIAKLDMNGIPDPNFGNNGINILNIDQLTYGENIFFGGDNKFYIGGSSGQGGLGAPRDFFLARYDYDGFLDASFSGVGYVKTSVGSAWDHAYSLDIGPDGKIVLVGFTAMGPTGDNDRAIVRYLNDYVPVNFHADFSASSIYVCEGYSVNFTDESEGTNLSWNWTFEGGTPATSTLQNPVVTYNVVGTYDVKLVISDGTQLDSLTKYDYIHVELMPSQPDQPTGPAEVCQNVEVEYSTYTVENANYYEWEVVPSDAGTISGTDTIGYFIGSTEWSGTFTVKVRAQGSCDSGPWSTELLCNLNLNPFQYQITGDTGYCQGSDGSEILLDGSQIGVDYELFKDYVSTGIIVAGTGDQISFGYFTEEGLYSATGTSTTCFEDMLGEIWVHEVFPPEQPEIPNGPDAVCNYDSTSYYITDDPNVNSYQWVLLPTDAGEFYLVNDTAVISWSESFSGVATLSVSGENECGSSSESILEIDVFASPEPEISGLQLVCDQEQYDYQTTENDGSTYTWEVTGGTVVSGEGTNLITLLWGDPGTGTVIVTEENADGCVATSDTLDVVIDECIGIDENVSDNINVFPNPTDGITYISLDNGSLENIKVYNTNGELVLNIENPVENNVKLDLNTQPKGIYFAKILLKDANPKIVKLIRIK